MWHEVSHISACYQHAVPTSGGGYSHREESIFQVRHNITGEFAPFSLKTIIVLNGGEIRSRVACRQRHSLRY